MMGVFEEIPFMQKFWDHLGKREKLDVGSTMVLFKQFCSEEFVTSFLSKSQLVIAHQYGKSFSAEK